MRFDSLHLENFISHKDTTIRLADRGVILLQGRVPGDSAFTSNSAGKSACLPDGLLYALFGRTLRGAKGKSIVHRQVGKNCCVTLTAQDKNGAQVIIRRPQLHSDYTRPSVQIGAEQYIGDDEVKRVIDLLLGGIDYDTFCSALVFGKGDAQFFTQRTDAERKDILSRLLQFGELDRCALATKKTLTGLGDSMFAKGIGISQREETQQALREVLTRMVREAALRQQQRAERRAKLEHDAALLKKQLAGITDAIATAEIAHADCLRKKEEAAKKYLEINDAYEINKKTQLEIQEVQTSLTRHIAGLIKAQEEVQGLSGGACPTCKQEVSEEHSYQCTSVISEQLAYLREQQAEVSKSLGEVASQGWRDKLQTIIYVVAEEDAALKDRQLTLNGLHAREREIVQFYKNISSQLTEEEAVVDDESAIRDTTLQLEVSVAETKKLKKDLEVLERLMPYYQTWEVGYGNAGIRSMLLDEKIPALNISAEKYSELLTDGAMRIRFNPVATLASGERREKFTVEVTVRGQPTTYELCSDGQRRRVDIITTLALSDLAAAQIGGPLNLLILDEVFDGLDATGMERAAQMLLHMERESIFVITHSDNMASLFHSVATVVYENGYSRLEDR